jgi:hypothetical protein
VSPPAATVAARKHVAIVHPWVAQALLNGTKTIESRFSRDKRPPFGRIARGATIYFRIAGGGYAVKARVAGVRCLDELTPDLVEQIEADHREHIGGDDAYWQAARGARCATLVHLAACQAVSRGPTLERHRGDRRAWFVLG